MRMLTSAVAPQLVSIGAMFVSEVSAPIELLHCGVANPRRAAPTFLREG
jgi:hypothetical protein